MKFMMKNDNNLKLSKENSIFKFDKSYIAYFTNLSFPIDHLGLYNFFIKIQLENNHI